MKHAVPDFRYRFGDEIVVTEAHEVPVAPEGLHWVDRGPHLGDKRRHLFVLLRKGLQK